MEKGGGQEWSNLIYSMGVKRVYSERILRELEERMEWVFEVGKPQEISNVIYALSYLGYDYKLINGVEYNTQECCNLLYAISISGKIYETGEEEVNRLINRIQWEEVTREGVNQINVFRCFAECEGVEVKLVKEVLEEGFRSKQSEGSKSFENEVCKELERWGYGGFEREVSPFEVEREIFKIDIAWRGEKVALEVDGPTHFLRGTDGKLRRDGPTKAKKRLLEGLGWKVVRLSSRRNEKLKKMEEEGRRKFWKKKLGKVGIHPEVK
ncbi:hypothetical protein TrST_g4752 [Triparma strigata]|uniref:RAP domain-containing protein n=1 Tax=Triparma strigata TaxID=1606541 RepID=A0A9W7AVA7_9STRA|nr:hypothetical protein TrST_g4752 [Triparma strigata]